MNQKIIIKNDQGEEKEFEILFSFNSKNTNKTYITYTDFEKNSEGIISCYSSIYDNGTLYPVETEEENKVIEEILNTITETAKVKYKIINN